MAAARRATARWAEELVRLHPILERERRLECMLESKRDRVMGQAQLRTQPDRDFRLDRCLRHLALGDEHVRIPRAQAGVL